LARQLPLPLEIRPAFRREDFIVSPSNAEAVKFIDSWPQWPARRGALFGPQGCGKSHLVEVWRAASGAVRFEAGELAEERIAGLPADAAIAIEDIDSGSASAEKDRVLLDLFERPKGALLLTGTGAPHLWPTTTGDMRSRFSALLGIAMAPPDDALLGDLTRKLFGDRQLRVTDAVVTRILNAIERTPQAVSAFIAAADAKALAERRAVGERLVLELLGETAED
jgi:chromosomal replication initiation ATPase DnaA